MAAFQRYLTGAMAVALVAVLCSCKDLGSDFPRGQLTSSSDSISVGKASAVQATLSGGIAPYSIKTQPNVTIATASITSTTLTITGVDTGQTFVVVEDSRSPAADTVKVHITVVAGQPVSFSGQIQPIFDTYCTGCHGSNGGLTLTAGASHLNLVNVQAQSSCTSMKRVLPHNADSSVLYRKVSGASCGIPMPQGGTLSTSDVDLIRNWINEEAPNN
jgi:mono/diheme cytochrome c family protein